MAVRKPEDVGTRRKHYHINGGKQPANMATMISAARTLLHDGMPHVSHDLAVAAVGDPIGAIGAMGAHPARHGTWEGHALPGTFFIGVPKPACYYYCTSLFQSLTIGPLQAGGSIGRRILCIASRVQQLEERRTRARHGIGQIGEFPPGGEPPSACACAAPHI